MTSSGQFGLHPAMPPCSWFPERSPQRGRAKAGTGTPTQKHAKGPRRVPRAGFQPRGQRPCMALPTLEAAGLATLICCPDSLVCLLLREQGAAVNPPVFGVPGEEAQAQKGGDKGTGYRTAGRPPRYLCVTLLPPWPCQMETAGPRGLPRAAVGCDNSPRAGICNADTV